MNSQRLLSNSLLLLTALIWGFAFAAQRLGMQFVGPFTFNAVRFALGSISLIPLLIIFKKKPEPATGEHRPMHQLLAGAVLGIVLFGGASLQQIGIVYTSAGKAGFITGLYVVLVPILGLFWKQATDLNTWFGAVLAAIGLYLLSVTQSFTIEYGDFLVLIGAFFWAGHMLLIGWYTRYFLAIKLAFMQFLACSILSFGAALILESMSFAAIWEAALPILYGGLMSVGIAYTLQVVAQRHAHPAHAAIILSLESVFAVVGGWIVLGEILGLRALIGCALMLLGMIISQIRFGKVGATELA